MYDFNLYLILLRFKLQRILTEMLNDVYVIYSDVVILKVKKCSKTTSLTCNQENIHIIHYGVIYPPPQKKPINYLNVIFTLR